VLSCACAFLMCLSNALVLILSILWPLLVGLLSFDDLFIVLCTYCYLSYFIHMGYGDIIISAISMVIALRCRVVGIEYFYVIYYM